MTLSYNFLQNKNIASIMLGILLIGYLYLDTPIPFNIVLEKMSLLVTILLVIFVTCYLLTYSDFSKSHCGSFNYYSSSGMVKVVIGLENPDGKLQNDSKSSGNYCNYHFSFSNSYYFAKFH